MYFIIQSILSKKYIYTYKISFQYKGQLKYLDIGGIRRQI